MDKACNPATVFSGTGFFADGLTVITNAHVVNATLNDSWPKTELGIVVGKGDAVAFRKASLIGLDLEHDLASLRIEEVPLTVASHSARRI